MQQYVIDLVCNLEAEKLSYLRDHQGQLQASASVTLRELLGKSCKMEDKSILVRAGRLFIFRLTHFGGERYMHQQMH